MIIHPTRHINNVSCSDASFPSFFSKNRVSAPILGEVWMALFSPESFGFTGLWRYHCLPKVMILLLETIWTLPIIWRNSTLVGNRGNSYWQTDGSESCRKYLPWRSHSSKTWKLKIDSLPPEAVVSLIRMSCMKYSLKWNWIIFQE